MSFYNFDSQEDFEFIDGEFNFTTNTILTQQFLPNVFKKEFQSFPTGPDTDDKEIDENENLLRKTAQQQISIEDSK